LRIQRNVLFLANSVSSHDNSDDQHIGLAPYIVSSMAVCANK